MKWAFAWDRHKGNSVPAQQYLNRARYRVRIPDEACQHHIRDDQIQRSVANLRFLPHKRLLRRRWLEAPTYHSLRCRLHSLRYSASVERRRHHQNHAEAVKMALRLDEEKIDSINILSLGYTSNYNYNSTSYFEAMMARYDFTEKELISLLCTAFNDYADMYNDYMDGKRETLYNMDFSLSVEFHGKSDYTFYLKLDTKTADQFYKLLYSNQEFYNIYMELPELTEKDNIYFSNSTEISTDETFAKELYKCLKKELAEGGIPPKKWIQIVDNYGIGYITVSKYIDSVYYEMRVPINLTVPKTYQKLLDYYAETHGEDLENFLDSLQNFEETFANSSYNESNNNINLDITGYDSINEISHSIYFSTVKENQTEYESENSYLKKSIALLKEYSKSVSHMIPEEDILIYARTEEENYISNYISSDSYILCIPVKIFNVLDTEGLEQQIK